MTTIKDLEMALKALGFRDNTPEEYYSDLTKDYKIEYIKDCRDYIAYVSITDENIKITALKGARIVSKDIKVKVFTEIVEYPIYWTTRVLSKLSKEV